jgi:hypothetical protein
MKKILIIATATISVLLYKSLIQRNDKEKSIEKTIFIENIYKAFVIGKVPNVLALFNFQDSHLTTSKEDKVKSFVTDANHLEQIEVIK